ncbi:MAG: serine protease [Bacteroidota bacterium]
MKEEKIKIDTYLQDPFVAAQDPDLAFVELEFSKYLNLSDGPTSPRFAVVDYNGNIEELASPAVWDADRKKFRKGKGVNSTIINQNQKDSHYFHQVNVWAILENALAFYEGPNGMGRRIPWGFDSNRLIVVPHAGYGKNAFYDRTSKSLQFYFYKDGDEMVYTCLSADIIRHEFGHAILDGIRPYYIEGYDVQTGAFHEFIGDFSAILILFRNSPFRHKLAEETAGNLDQKTYLSSIAEQFGDTVKDRPNLRTATSELTIPDLDKPENEDRRDSPHFVSNVMTGTMYQILIEIAKIYIEERERTAVQSLAYNIDRMQRTLLQPIDFLPPVDVNFKDYARAVLRYQQLSDPLDPYDYYKTILEVFVARGILSENEGEELLEKKYLFDRNILNFKYQPNIEKLIESPEAAYVFLDQHREELGIPKHIDFKVMQPYTARKNMRQNLRRPPQYVLQYVWREEIPLDGNFGALEGEIITLLCGGTLVLDDFGRVLSWMLKPGSKVTEYQPQGIARKERFLEIMQRHIHSGRLNLEAAEIDQGLIGKRQAPLAIRQTKNGLEIINAPHMHIDEEADHHDKGTRQWELSF